MAHSSALDIVLIVWLAVVPLAYALDYLPQPSRPAAYTAIVHNGPSAVSHQTFTRLAATSGTTRIGHILTPSFGRESSPTPLAYQVTAQTTTRTATAAQTPIVETLTHTPAHLTYAATPIVYQMLPQIKPVRTISYESLRPGPRAHYTLQ